MIMIVLLLGRMKMKPGDLVEVTLGKHKGLRAKLVRADGDTRWVVAPIRRQGQMTFKTISLRILPDYLLP